MQPKQLYSWRVYFVAIILLLAFLGLILRMVYLNIGERKFLCDQSYLRSIRVINIPAHRGMIADRNGNPLAISTRVDSIWINPKILTATSRQLHDLAKLLHIDYKVLIKKINKNSKTYFVYLKRHVTPEIIAKVLDLKIPGLFLRPEYKRYYPEGEVTSHVVGFTNIDDQGQEGLELAFDEWLRGKPGEKKVIKDRLGHIVANLNTITEPQDGKDLNLSIDNRIQYSAYYQLKKTVAQYHAESGSVVVLDVKTGEILAMVNQPFYNPNKRIHDQGQYRNRAVTDVFEPGSTLKTFSITSALASGKYTPTTKVDTNPGWLVVDGNTIDDEHINYGVLDVTGVLQKSSNIGVAKITLSLPATNLWTLLAKVGFGQRTTSGFPGEVDGTLPVRKVWRPFVLATLAFGYGITVTPLQLAYAYAVIAAGGIKRPVSFVKVDDAPQETRVIDAKVAQEMMQMLETVVQRGGTGSQARVSGFSIAGKTGTSYIAGPHGYNKKQHMASFVGIAPASDPRLVVAVVIRNPQEQHLGGLVAAPAFAAIMQDSLRVMGLLPDNVMSIS